MSTALESVATQTIRDLLASQQVVSAFHFFEESAEAITEEQIRICSIPSSPFAEQQRAEYLRKRFEELGLKEASIDGEGNCLALLQGRSLSPLLVISAHLDTVFSKNTDFSITRRNGRLLGPGISDDGCGLVALVALADAVKRLEFQTRGSVLFVGTVGEEGEGNLRGVRYLLTEGAWANRIDTFISFDGPGADRITNQALGSRRYRIQLKGAGGHSWGDFGSPNAIHAMGRAIARLVNYPAPKEPRTTFNIGRIEGGESVNAIPADACMEVDLRSADDIELRRLDAYFRRAVTDAVDEENRNARPGDTALQMQLDLIGTRPTGQTPADSFIVELAEAATRAVGFEPKLEQASTDSNLPIALGLPAITLGAGGQAGLSHTLAEWYEPKGRDRGLKRALLVMLGVAGVVTD
jgi:acetylornithine deacetylase/succinyl-diaminopimelate desuccinylase-like protein